MAHKNKKYNKYILEKEIGNGYTLKGEVFYFDTEDFDKIKDYCWYVENGQGRLCSRTPIKFHRLVMGFPDKSFEVDHINKNRLDNRKTNLRICSHKENIWNRGIQKNNKFGVTGVYFRSDTNKYYSRIEINSNVINLGNFKTIDEAIIARLIAEEEYFGEFAPQRNLFKLYNIKEN